VVVTGWSLAVEGQTVVVGIGDGGSIKSGKKSGINPPSGTRVLDNSETTGVAERGLHCMESLKNGNEFKVVFQEEGV